MFEAERDFFHQIGRSENGGWSVWVKDTPERFLAYGPYTTAIAAGKRTATFRLLLDNVTADDLLILSLDVYDASTGRVLARQDVRRRQFGKNLTYQDFRLNFDAPRNHRLEFRTYWHNYSYARLDKVTVE